MVYWATPFKIHAPPVEDFEKVYHKGGMNFQMHPPYGFITEGVNLEMPNELIYLEFMVPL